MTGNRTNEQIGWIIKERQQGKTLDQITKDFNEKFGANSITKVMEICDRHLDAEHIKQFITRFRKTDQEVSWIVKALQQVKGLQQFKRLQTLKTRRLHTHVALQTITIKTNQSHLLYVFSTLDRNC